MYRLERCRCPIGAMCGYSGSARFAIPSGDESLAGELVILTAGLDTGDSDYLAASQRNIVQPDDVSASKGLREGRSRPVLHFVDDAELWASGHRPILSEPICR